MQLNHFLVPMLTSKKIKQRVVRKMRFAINEVIGVAFWFNCFGRDESLILSLKRSTN